MPKEGAPDFKKEDLAKMWEQHGASFVANISHKVNVKWRDSFKLPPEVCIISTLQEKWMYVPRLMIS